MFQSNEINTFTPLVELIAKHFSMNLAGKCLMSAFEDHFLHQTFKEVTTTLNVEKPGKLFLHKLKTASFEKTTKPNWPLYYSLCKKFDIDTNKPDYFLTNVQPQQQIVFQQPLSKTEAIGSTYKTDRTTGKEPILTNPLDPIHLQSGFKPIGRVMAESSLLSSTLAPNGELVESSFSENDNMRNPHQRYCEQPNPHDFHKTRNKEGFPEKKYLEGDMYTRQGWGDVKLKTIHSQKQHNFNIPTPNTPWKSPTPPALTAQEIADEIHNWERILKSDWLRQRQKVLGSKIDEINSFIAKLMEQLRALPKEDQDKVI